MFKTVSSECEFREDSKIFYKKYFGDVTLDLLKNSWLEMVKNNQIPVCLRGAIIDYTNAHLNVEISGADAIVKFYNEHLPILMTVKVAIVVGSPHDVVIPILISQKLKGKFSKPFSSIDAAEEWILM